MLNKPRTLAFFTIILWSFGIYLRRLVSFQSQYALLSLSLTFSLLVFWVYARYQHHDALWPRLRKVRRSFWFFGLFGYFFYFLGLIQGFRHFNSASEVSVLNYTWPLFTVVFTEALFNRHVAKGRAFRLVEGIGIACGFLSIVVLATEGQIITDRFANLPGILWGLLAGSSYGFFSAFSRTVSKEEHSLFLLVSVTVSLVFMLLFSLSELDKVQALTFRDILLVMVTGCLVDGLGSIFWTRANRLAYEQAVNISAIASMMFVLPVLSLVIITILLGENRLFQPYFLVSLLLILMSSLLCQKPEMIIRFVRRG